MSECRSFFPSPRSPSAERRLGFGQEYVPAFKDSVVRSLRVVVDHDVVLAAGQTAFGPDASRGQVADISAPVESLLLGLLKAPEFFLLQYGDFGAPDDVPRRESFLSDPIAEGWLEVHSASDDPANDFTACSARFLDDDDKSSFSVIAREEWLRLMSQLPTAGYYPALSSDEEAAQLRRDALMVFAAEAVNTDLLITSRLGALDPPLRLTDGVTVLSPEAALPVIGLHLRRQGEFVIYRNIEGNATYRTDASSFWWMASHRLLDHSWNWILTGSKRQAELGDDRVAWLMQSAIERVSRSLRARDRVHAGLLIPQDSNSGDLVLDSLDSLLVNLMGALDAIARAADVILDLQTSKTQVGWQFKRWTKKVAELRPMTNHVLKNESETFATLTILRKLRNCVHGEALAQFPFREDSTGPWQTLVGLPESDRSTLLEAAERSGGVAAWGFREVLDGRTHADIGRLTDRLFERTIILINELLFVVHPEEAKRTPTVPPEGENFLWTEMVAASILWQLGLDVSL